MTDTSSPQTTTRSFRWLWWLLPVAWMALIWTLSAQSDLLVTVNSQLRDALSWVAHFGEFAALALFIWLALRKTTTLSQQTMFASAFFGAALFAASDEIHQAFVPGRTPDIRDLLVDVAGILLALALIRWLAGRRGA